MDLLKQAPRLSARAGADIARELYGVDATATPLPSERDQNFRIDLTEGSGRAVAHDAARFVLKIANASEDAALLAAQNAAMTRVATATSLAPRVVPTRDGVSIATLPQRWGGGHFVRMVTWLPGVTLGSVPRHSPALMRDLGRRVGDVDRALESFDHPAIHRDFYWDLASGLQVVHERARLIQDPTLAKLVASLANEIECRDAPAFSGLRKSAIHNDANDHNVVVDDGGDLVTRRQQIRGFIDFGDLVYSFTVADLAIAIAYGVLDKPDPLGIAASIAAGYHQAFPLTGDEIAVLFGLVCLRLCMSASIAADQQRQRPGDEYLAISQEPLRRTLPRLAAIPRRLADAVFRQACGLMPVPASARIARALRDKGPFASVVASPPGSGAPLVLDLSVSSPLVSADAHHNNASALARRIADAMIDPAATAVGRYGEARLLYTSPMFAQDDDPHGERRTVHLGMDLFAPAGTPVHAPLKGTVHALADNSDPQDYGPVVVLEHEADGGDRFWTLYGHLNRESLARLQVGQAIPEGERFAAIGAPDVNGGWTPHVHFQIITDLLDLGCEFPGVCRASEWPVWTALSPDPNVVLGVPPSAFPPAEPARSSTLAERRSRLGRNLSLAYRDPVKAVRAWRQYLYDETGRRFIDAYNNVPHVGHCHPRVVAAAVDAMRVLNTNTRYLHDNLTRYAARLTATLPEPLRVCFFVNSGSEANELALRLARAHTRQRDLIVLDEAYHGNTTTLVSISPYKFNGPGGEGAPPWVHTVPIPDVYRGPHKASDPAAGRKYAQSVEAVIDALAAGGRGLSGYIAESAPSVGGQILLPPGYLEAVYRAVRNAGGVCIADEVQTAFGRLGNAFYAFETQHVVPDIVVLGKPIGNGHPIGAVVTTAAIARSFDNGMEFFSTFGGNTVSCAVGLAVLDVVQGERLQDHARRVGDHLLARLRELAKRHALVGDVRGAGLFIGVELVKSRDTLQPAGDEASFVVNRMREEGVLIGTEGPYGNVLKIRPPMPFDESDADRVSTVLDRILTEVEP
jgi:4-aminobutyrate aminotransferase-like enzyme/Ser/Thr protein kinase RdoA (MazF antagonist)